MTTPEPTIPCPACRGRFPVNDVFGVGVPLVVGLLGSCPACACEIRLASTESIGFDAPRGPAGIVNPPDCIDGD